MSRDFLFEIGVEELPASFVARALDALPELAAGLFRTARLSHGSIRAVGTPRRLALVVEQLANRQDDLSEELTGPAKSIAFAADGSLTRAGEAFAKKHGVALSQLKVVETAKGAYIGALREEKGKSAKEVLPELLNTLCTKIPFQKSMRWAEGNVAFGRPVHWLVAMHGEEPVPTTFAGAVSSVTTRGHRFLGTQHLTVASPSSYVDSLRADSVLVDGEERRRVMDDALHAAAARLGGTLVPDAFLVEECASLVEYPFVVDGAFEQEFLDLPEDVIVAVMRGHQRYFAVRGPDGKLLPRYLNVVNTAKDPDTIRRGNDRVLRARLKDARFFVDEDQKRSFGVWQGKLDGVVFQAKLGTVGEKARRVEQLAVTLVAEADKAQCSEASRLAKADLVSLIVGEFPELQGAMGRWYALREKVDGRVADAIRDHYSPKGASDSVPTEPVAAAIAAADRMDTLVGCFAVGIVPTGSADPFALRRAALGIIRIALEGPADLSLMETVGRAYDLYEGKKLKPKSDVLRSLEEFFRGRLKSYFGDQVGADVVEACLLAWPAQSLRDLKKRIEAVHVFRSSADFAALATAFKRSHNIAKDTEAGPVDSTLFAEPAERQLGAALEGLRPLLTDALSRLDYAAALVAITRELREPVDAFFTNVFVMVDDAAVRQNRLRLLRNLADTVSSIAHIHTMQVEAP